MSLRRALHHSISIGVMVFCLSSTAHAQTAGSGTTVGSRELSDTAKIIELKTRYAYAVDDAAKDPSKSAAITDTMTDDVVVVYDTAGTFTGKAAVQNFFQNLLPLSIAWSFHLPLQPLIEITGPDTATGRWYVLAYGVYKPYYGPPVTVYGRYREEYVRTASGWKIKRLDLKLDFPPTGP